MCYNYYKNKFKTILEIKKTNKFPITNMMQFSRTHLFLIKFDQIKQIKQKLSNQINC